MTLESLTQKDKVDLLEFLNGILSCKKEDEFKSHVLSLNRLISFEYSVCARGSFGQTFTTKSQTYDVKNIFYPEHYLERYILNGYHLIDPMLAELLKTNQLQNWSDVNDRLYKGQKNIVYQEAEESGLLDGFTYGVPDLERLNMPVFYFGGRYVENNDRTRTILKRTVPFLCEKLSRILICEKREQARERFQLTPREQEVLKWLKEGKTSLDIGCIFNISERGVNFHVNNIIRKLNATNRSHAVAIAVESQLVEL